MLFTAWVVLGDEVGIDLVQDVGEYAVLRSQDSADSLGGNGDT